jgi:hypothetical protein
MELPISRLNAVYNAYYRSSAGAGTMDNWFLIGRFNLSTHLALAVKTAWGSWLSDRRQTRCASIVPV